VACVAVAPLSFPVEVSARADTTTDFLLIWMENMFAANGTDSAVRFSGSLTSSQNET
jgi:hypothetical protein